MPPLARTLLPQPRPRNPRATALPYIDLVMVKTEFQIIIDGLVGDFAQQGQVRNTNLLLLGALESRLLDLRLAARYSAIAHVSDCF